MSSLTIVPLSTGILGPQGSQLIANLGDGSPIRRGGDHLGRDDRGSDSEKSDDAAEHGDSSVILVSRGVRGFVVVVVLSEGLDEVGMQKSSRGFVGIDQKSVVVVVD